MSCLMTTPCLCQDGVQLESATLLRRKRLQSGASVKRLLGRHQSSSDPTRAWAGFATWPARENADSNVPQFILPRFLRLASPRFHGECSSRRIIDSERDFAWFGFRREGAPLPSAHPRDFRFCEPLKAVLTCRLARPLEQPTGG